MRLFDIVKSSLAPEARSLSFQDIWDKGYDLDSGANRAGVRVTSDTSATLTAVFASWRIISDGIATLPRDSMQRVDGIPKPYRPRPEWLDYPCNYEAWIDFISQIMVSLLSTGNAFVAVHWVRNTTGGYNLGALVVLDPALCRHEVANFVTVTNRDSGQSVPVPEVQCPRTGPVKPGADMEIVHIKGMTRPGKLEGLSPIAACADALGVAIAAQKYGAAFFENDGTPGGIIEVPAETRLSETGQKALRQAWGDLFSGPGKAKRIAVLTEGAKFREIQINPNEAQFLETRKFGVQEVARIYGVPPHLISDTTNSTGWGTGMAEQNTAYVIHTLRPWIERVEGRLTTLLQLEVMFNSAATGRIPGVYVHLNEEALLRGATKERWEVHRSNVTAGILTADEARFLEGMDPLPDGAGAVPWIPLAQAPQGFAPEAEGDNDDE